MSATVSSSGGFPELDKYELHEEIGHGGMATVYRARDLRLDRAVAVKVIHKHLRENPEVRRRFVSEAKAVAKLRHPGIVDVYDVSDEDDAERFLVVELIRGESLRQWLQKQERMPAEIGAIMVSILCDAVEHAHQCGVIHRDIKPENVLLEPPPPPDREAADPEESGEADLGTTTDPRVSSERGRRRVRIKLTDFGIAKVLDAQGVTSTGQILGSPAHMAPEQIEGGDIGPTTDVFALGVLLYECLVGHLPFEGRNPAQVLRRVLAGDFDPVDLEAPAVGQRWAAIVASALQTDPTERPQSAAALGALIDEELVALGIEEPRMELVDYFDDPEGYADRLPDRLVPRLLARGEAERRAGNAPLAAGDFNRALALNPNDLAILKRVSSLSAQTAWKQRAVRMSAIVAGSLALGGTAFGVTRLVKGADQEPTASLTAELPRVGPDAVTPEPRDAQPDGAEPPLADASSEPSPPPSPSGTVKKLVKPLSRVNAKATASAPDDDDRAPTSRRVMFTVSPPGGKLKLDGAEVNWFGTVFDLSIGRHAVWAGLNDDCCESTQMNVTVRPAPDGKPDEIQKIDVSFKVKPATVVLVGAPDGASMTCLGKTATAAASTSLQMAAVVRDITCHLSNGQQRSVRLKAGRAVTVQWPGG